MTRQAIKKTGRIDIYRKGAGLPGVLTAISVICGLLSVFIVVYMISLLWEGAKTGTVLWLGATICLCQTGKAVFYALALWKAHDFAYSSLLEIRLAMIEHLRRLPMSFFQKRKIGDFVNIIEHDVERVELYLAHTLPDVVITNMVCLFIFVVVVLLDWRLGIALISTIPVMFTLMPVFNKIWSKSVGAYHDSIKKVSENIVEYIGSIAAIKAFGNEEAQTEKVLSAMKDYIIKAKKAVSSQTAGISFIAFLTEAGIVVVSIAGSIVLKSGDITAWKTIVFILSVILAGQFAKNFSKSFSFSYNKIVFKNTMTAIDSVMNEPTEAEKNISSLAEAGDICFDEVSFAYNERGEALKNVSAVFGDHSVNAIVGPSGAGKSTITNLIMGFWRAGKGAVTIAGKNINNFGEGDLKSLVSIVQQDTFLFNGSIEENIKLGNEAAGHDEVIEAAKKACIHDVIMGFPQQYQTTAGEAGEKLSGGERQRIAIARMILKDSPVIILDEATAAIDPYNEHLIQRAIGNLCEHKTLIIIAHHLSAIVAARQIIVMKNGSIVSRGTHETLLETSELYRSMFEAEKLAGQWNIKGGTI